MLRKRVPVVAAMLAAALLAARIKGTEAAAAAAASQAGAMITQKPDLFIYDPSGTTLLGRAHYTVTQHDDSVTIDGRNEFIDGERDLEHDTLKAVPGEAPQLLTYEHRFFDAHGAPQLIATADAVTGKTSCAKYDNGEGTIQTAVLQFPPDTYAGAGVLVPIADRLRHGADADLDMHVFDCAHGPRILSLHVDLGRSPWKYRPQDGELVEAQAQPVFGWFNVFLKAFVPTTQLWFDPRQDFVFMGGMLSRYYRGPEVLLVSTAPPVKPHPVFERPEPPAFIAPHGSETPAQSSSAPLAPLSSATPSAPRSAALSATAASALEHTAPRRRRLRWLANRRRGERERGSNAG